MEKLVFRARLRGSTELSLIPPTAMHVQCPHHHHPHQSGAFVTVDGATRAHGHEASSPSIWLTSGLIPDAGPSVGLDRRVTTCIHQQTVVPGSLTALGPLCSDCPSRPPRPATTRRSPRFCLFRNVGDWESHTVEPFQTGFSHFATCVSGSPVSFHGRERISI